MKTSRIIFSLAALPLLAAFATWLLGIWSGDGRWAETGNALSAATALFVTVGIITAIWEDA